MSEMRKVRAYGGRLQGAKTKTHMQLLWKNRSFLNRMSRQEKRTTAKFPTNRGKRETKRGRRITEKMTKRLEELTNKQIRQSRTQETTEETQKRARCNELNTEKTTYDVGLKELKIETRRRQVNVIIDRVTTLARFDPGADAPIIGLHTMTLIDPVNAHSIIQPVNLT